MFQIDGEPVVTMMAKRANSTMGTFLVEVDDLLLVERYPYWYMTAAGYVYTMRECGRFKWLTAVLMEKRLGYVIDHVDRCPMDNRRSNLRYLTQSDNAANSSARRHSRTGVKGVKWHRQSGTWSVRLVVNGRQRSFGYYRDFEEACAVAAVAHLWARPALYPEFISLWAQHGPDWVPGMSPRRRAVNGQFIEQRSAI